MPLDEHDNELDIPPEKVVFDQSTPDVSVHTDHLEDFDEAPIDIESIDISSGSQDVLASSTISQSQEQTRARIALMFTQVFLFLVLVSVLLPFILHVIRSDLFPQPLVAVKEMITTVASILAGPFGFIVGFYFKKESD